MPRVQILSDIHSRWDQCVFDPSAQLLVALGDLTEGIDGVKWLSSAKRPVLYIPGNHEYYGQEAGSLLSDLENAAVGTDVKIMDRKTASAAGWRFLCATLWTDHNSLDPKMVARSAQTLNDYQQIHTRQWFKNTDNRSRYEALRSSFLSQSPELSGAIPARPDKMNPIVSLCLHQDAVNYFIQELAKPWSGKTFALTHHAPSSQSLVFGGYLASFESATLGSSFDRKPKSHKIGAYASGLEYLFSNHSIDLWAHGHLHEGLRYSLHGGDVLSNPTGYNDRQNDKYQPSFVIELDDPTRHPKCLALTLSQSARMQKEALLLLRRCALMDPLSAKELFARVSDFEALIRIYNQAIGCLLAQSPRDRARPDFIVTPMSPKSALSAPCEPSGRLTTETRSRLLHELLTLAQNNEKRTQDWLASALQAPELAKIGWTPEAGF